MKLHTTVAITGFHSTDSLKPGLNIARSIKEAVGEEVKIISIESYPISPSLGLAHLIDEAYLIPAASEGPSKVLNSLKEIVNKTKIDVLIPNDDEEVQLFSEIQDEIRTLGIELLIPSPEKVFAVSKEGLYPFGKEQGYLIPFTKVFNRWSEFENDGFSLNYPFLLKGLLCDSYLVHSKEEAKVYFDRIIKIWDPPVIAQEFISGEEYSVVALANRHSEVIGAVAIKKFGINEKGTTWAGATVMEPQLLELATKVIDDLRWIGPLEIETIKEEESGSFYIIEINPRFPAWTYLATKAGQNLPLALINIARGKRIEKFPPYKSGLMFMRTSSEVVFKVDRLGNLITGLGVKV
jgi:carbamoyl-phosphate synthase large subunit